MQDYLILDTETTGVGAHDEVIELGIIDNNGTTHYHSLFKPQCPIHPRAASVHGITHFDLADAPPFSEEWAHIAKILAGRTVLIYNAQFDTRLLNQTARLHGQRDLLHSSHTRCVMLDYAKLRNEINPKTKKARWFKLEQALRDEGILMRQTHRVIGDCLMTLALVKKMHGGS